MLQRALLIQRTLCHVIYVTQNKNNSWSDCMQGRGNGWPLEEGCGEGFVTDTVIYSWQQTLAYCNHVRSFQAFLSTFHVAGWAHLLSSRLWFCDYKVTNLWPQSHPSWEGTIFHLARRPFHCSVVPSSSNMQKNNEAVVLKAESQNAWCILMIFC